MLLTTTVADDTQEDKTAEERHTKGLEQWPVQVKCSTSISVLYK